MVSLIMVFYAISSPPATLKPMGRSLLFLSGVALVTGRQVASFNAIDCQDTRDA